MKLIGSWEVGQSGQRTLAGLGDTALEFDAAGRLRYIVFSGDGEQMFSLRCEVEGGLPTEDQSSAAQVERTAFSIFDDGLLTLVYGGQPNGFRREPTTRTNVALRERNNASLIQFPS